MGALVPGPSCVGVKTAIAKLKKYKSSGSDQILERYLRSTNLLILFAIRKNCPISWRTQFFVPIHKKRDKTD
jgi:hypothetical protein